MISSFDFQNLENLLKDFYAVVGIRFSVFNDEFQLVTEYPKQAPRFCQNIRKSAKGRAACAQCDKEACQTAKKMRTSHIYVCHAGITEAITPIQIGSGVLGYAILAHMLPTEGYEQAVQKASELARQYGVSEEESKEALKEIVPKSAEQIHSSVRLLDALASYVYTKNYVHWKNEDISSHIEKYIKQNLAEQLTSEDICKHFNCSRAFLYNVSMQTFGMSIMQFVTFCRMEKAKQLLLEGKTIKETSFECGFLEYNYFCKVFKKHVGTSPSAFRKQNQ